MTDIKEFVTEYIQREYTVPEDVDIMTLNYIEAMAFIQFISTIEDEYDIEFEVEDIENPKLRIVGKLIDFIQAKIDEQH